MRNLLTSKGFKDALKANTEGIGATTGVYKEYTTEVKQVGAEEDRTLEFCITTDSVDRHGDTVSAKGWQTAAYEKNPVVLFAHDYDSLPVGKSVGVTKFKNGLRSQVKFAPATANPFAEQVYQMCKGGFLNAASVGFIPLEYDEAERDGYYPMDITKSELLEWSIVPVPANGEALQGASAGDTSILKEWAEKTLVFVNKGGVQKGSDKVTAVEAATEIAAPVVVAPIETAAPVVAEPVAAVAETKEAPASDPVLTEIEKLGKRLDAIETKLAAPAPVVKEETPAVAPAAPALGAEKELSAEDIVAICDKALAQFEYEMLGRVPN